MRKSIGIILFLIVLVASAAIHSVDIIKRTAQGYLYLYPLVLIDETRQTMLSQDGTYVENNFTHSHTFPDHTFRNVVKPNNDTLYSIAWLDLTNEALVLNVPDTDGRHYVIPFMDAWSNVFDAVGKGTTGTKAGEFLIVGPDQSIPENGRLSELPVIKSPTNRVWIIGRIQTNGNEDVVNVSALQLKFTLTPTEQWLEGTRVKGNSLFERAKSTRNDPNLLIQSMDATAFFSRAAAIMKQQSPLSTDAGALANLMTLGISANNEVDKPSAISNWLMNKAINITNERVKERFASEDLLDNGWRFARTGLGRYGTNYDIRAAVSMIGLGALPPEEAVYPTTKVDGTGNLLNGKHRYILHFPANHIPPVQAFWSLTMYEDDGFLVNNPINRYAIGDRDNLNFNEDGSLDILIQHAAPSSTDNWLPAPEGDFHLTLRLYLPGNEAIDGRWQIPSVERVSSD